MRHPKTKREIRAKKALGRHGTKKAAHAGWAAKQAARRVKT